MERHLPHFSTAIYTGMLAGNLLGLKFGLESIPEQWIVSLEVKDLMTEITEDTDLVFGHADAEDEEAFQKKNSHTNG